MNRRGLIWLCECLCAALSLVLVVGIAHGQSTNALPSSSSTTNRLPGIEMPKPRLWSIEFGVGVITDNVPSDFLKGDATRLEGPGGGLTYNFTAARRCYDFDWPIGSIHLRPQLDRVAMLTIVDENSGRVVPDLNVGLTFRWRDFPWNSLLRTSVSVGAGFSYSFQIWTADEQRHPGEDRSRIKFWMPVELTVSLPPWPRHQAVFFLDHQSGGTLFDNGGVDVLGLGYRFEF